MNNKMTINSQLSTTESKKTKQTETKQTSRIGIESHKWSSHGGSSPGMGEKVQG